MNLPECGRTLPVVMKWMVKKVYAKAILKDPEVYFTEEVMQQLDEIASEEDFLLWNGLETYNSHEILICNENYSRKGHSIYRTNDYFEQSSEKVIFEEIAQFIVKYGSAITSRSTKY